MLPIEPERRTKRGESKLFTPIDELAYFAVPEDEQEISTTVQVTEADLEAEKNDLLHRATRDLGKQELVILMNEILVEEGMRPTYTPEILSAMASARIRRDQKAKKRKNKRR